MRWTIVPPHILERVADAAGDPAQRASPPEGRVPGETSGDARGRMTDSALERERPPGGTVRAGGADVKGVGVSL
ncbi:hypothetical protein ACFY4C_30875 [Actinomadura viridis]|uniref:hypothetical protein n=1 Tax=Actinomadura viridis TaxID=58110 RepID=UPI0036769276